MTVRPTARALNRPLLIAGVDRRLLGLAFIVSAVFAACSPVTPDVQMVIGLGVFLGATAAAKWATRKDDRIFQIASSVWKQKAVYDPLVRKV